MGKTTSAVKSPTMVKDKEEPVQAFMEVIDMSASLKQS